MYASTHLNDLWTNTCGLISRRGTCFWAGWSCMCNEVWKVWEGRQSIRITLKELENVSMFLNPTECKDMVVSQDDHMLYLLARRCCSLWCSLFSIRTSWHWGCIYVLSSPFSRQALALSSSLPSQLLPFWRRDKETASAATVLRKINLRKRIQLFGAFLSVTNCIPECDKLHSWSVTPHPSNREPSLQDYKALGNYLVHVYPRESPL